MESVGAGLDSDRVGAARQLDDDGLAAEGGRADKLAVSAEHDLSDGRLTKVEPPRRPSQARVVPHPQEAVLSGRGDPARIGVRR
ncbi:hypothetical protein GCM10029992_37220 [Glycomyces albus]